jgi:hypothetical protein
VATYVGLDLSQVRDRDGETYFAVGGDRERES